MPTGLLLGTSTAGGVQNGANHIVMSRWQALATGIVSQVVLYSLVNGQVKVAVYADSSGEPGSRLGVQQSATSVTAGQWNTIQLSSSFEVVKDTWYFVAFNATYPGVVGAYAATGYRRFKSFDFSNDMPDPAGSGYTVNTEHWDSTADFGVKTLSPSGYSQPVVYSTQKLNLSIRPSGLSQPVAYGTPEISTSGLYLNPAGLAQPLAYGAPTLVYPQGISPSGIVQPVAFGTHSIGFIGFISPQGIPQAVAFGTHTLLKYVWHVILDGHYVTETPEVNRTFVIGRDDFGNPVWGEAHDSTESALVGQRLDFQQELAIPTTAQASATADAILAKMRLTKAAGLILIPPNCGQEMFDVVELSDAGANQSAVKFRVVGIRFEYDPKQVKYEHKLILGAP